MHVTAVELKNFRGCRDVEIRLHEKLNVFCGVNGSGKSTILDAIAISLSCLANRVKTNNAPGRPIAESSIHNEADFAKIVLSGTFREKKFSTTLIKTRRGHTAEERTDLQKAKEVIEIIRHGINRSSSIRLPLLAYYPINRPVLKVPLQPDMKRESSVFEANDGALTGAANFHAFFKWFRNQEDIANERCRDVLYPTDDSTQRRQKGAYYGDPQLQIVRDAITAFMPDFNNLIVRRTPLRMEVLKNEKWFQIDQLSDGEKCLMAMVGDIARRLAIANPGDRVPPKGTVANFKGRTPLEGNGIILIDEIDLHLHPQWQRMVLPKLMETFPNCQFIVSTHSPNVLTHVRPESLFLLSMCNEKLTIDKPRTSYGRSVERILLDNMGLWTTRPESVAEDLDMIYTWIEVGEFSKAKKKIEHIREDMSDDPELIRASALIKRKELVGK